MNVLQAGRLSRVKEDYTIVQMGWDQIEAVAALQQRIYDGLDNKSLFVCDSAEEIAALLEKGGALFGVLNSKRQLIASRYISTPGISPDNLAHDLNLPIELDQVVVLESTVVDPAYRGNRLQSITLEIAIKYAERHGYNHLLCTISPQNIYSLYNIMAGGLKIKALKKKYATADHDGVWRFILHRDLRLEEPTLLRRLDIAFGDLDLQSMLIERGFIGDAVLPKSNTITYAM